MTVALVTDSTAELCPERVAELGVTVVPLQVIIDDDCYDEGSPEATPERITAALKGKRSVSTSRPPPTYFAELYQRLADEGATSILSIHLSSEMSGTFESAQVGSRGSAVPVTCVDTRQVGVATGYAVESAAQVIADGGTVADAARVARERSARSRSLFYVDTLEYLRRGGRIGGGAALLGGALAVKPLLSITDGVVTPVTKVRTAGKAIARLEALAVEAAHDDFVEVCVAHLGAGERAAAMVGRLTEQLGDQLVGDVDCRELGAVLGAHVGPGMLAICVAPVHH